MMKGGSPMKQLRKQRWLIVIMLFFVLISGIGTDATRIAQMDTSCDFRQESMLSILSSIRTDSPDLCSPEQLGIRVLQPKLEASRPAAFRQDGRQQRLLLLLYMAIIFCFCVFFARRNYEPAFYESLTHHLSLIMHFIHDKDGQKISLSF